MPRKLPNFLTDVEQELLLAAAQAELIRAATPGKRRVAWRDQMFVQVGRLMGLRVSEISKLDVEDLNLEQRSALVRQGKGAKDRYVPIAKQLVEPLRTWLAGRTAGPVFASPTGRRTSVRTIQLRITRLGKLAGLKKRLKAHSLRHTFATTLHHRGVPLTDIQELLGHNSIQTTSVYLHCDPARLQDDVDRL